MAPKSLSTQEKRDRVTALARQGLSKGEVGRRLGMPRTTVSRHWPDDVACHDAPEPFAHQPCAPDPVPEAGGPSCPEPWHQEFEPFQIDGPGAWGVIADTHVPCHDRTVLETWVGECRERRVKGLLLNGDILDFHTVSDHLRDPSAPRVREELEKGRQLLAWLRSQFPRSRIVYKYGNHDERLRHYLIRKAPEIEELDEIKLDALLQVKKFGVEVVEDRRRVQLGKLSVVHGHEFQGTGGVMPARWVWLRTGESGMVGHFHHPSYYPFRTLSGKQHGNWSLGCACFLSPYWRRYNQWRHGWAFVELTGDGRFHVMLRERLRDGSVV